MKRAYWFLLVLIVLMALRALEPPRSAVDFGEHRAVVLQSDDWGLEAWFPSAGAARELRDLVEGLPPHLAFYAGTGLESAAQVDALADLFAGWPDSDGLPIVLQANHILSGPDLRSRPLTLHASGGASGPYRRPGLDAAVDRAIARGVWRPELHGLTHFDLAAYESARESGDPIVARAAELGVFAHEGWYRRSELDGHDAGRADSIAAESVRRFRERFGRAPVSVIAPDYRWGPEDEDAWMRQGIEVVQAKREQVDAQLRPGTLMGRVQKRWSRWWDERRRPFMYLDRPARLEPYGDPDPRYAQGAIAAAEAVREAWRHGEPGVVSVHRAQFVAFDPAVGQAGREQLIALLEILRSEGELRILVDDEVAQLGRTGVSKCRRGDEWVIRNWTGRVQSVSLSPDRTERLGPGNHRLPAGLPPRARRGSQGTL
jgi:hypothetical protein